MPHLDHILLCSNFCNNANVFKCQLLHLKSGIPHYLHVLKWFSCFSSGIKALVVALSVCTLVTSRLISIQVQEKLEEPFDKGDCKTEERVYKHLNSEELLFEFACLRPWRIPTNVRVCLCSAPFPPLPSVCHLERLGERKALEAQVHKQLGFSNFPAHKST